MKTKASVELGRMIREAREKVGMEQWWLGVALRVKPSVVRRWETGATVPRDLLDTWQIADLLGIDRDTLLELDVRHFKEVAAKKRRARDGNHAHGKVKESRTL